MGIHTTTNRASWYKSSICINTSTSLFTENAQLPRYTDTTFPAKLQTSSIYRHHYPGQTTYIRILMPRTAYIINVLRFSGQSDSIYRYHFSRKMTSCLHIPTSLSRPNHKYPYSYAQNRIYHQRFEIFGSICLHISTPLFTENAQLPPYTDTTFLAKLQTSSIYRHHFSH